MKTWKLYAAAAAAGTAVGVAVLAWLGQALSGAAW